MDRTRRLIGALVVVIVTALVVLVVTVRPGLRRDADATDTSWAPLVAPLSERYAALEKVSAALQAAGAGDRTLTAEMNRLLTRWKIIRTGDNAEEQVLTANRLEAVAARAEVLATTPRLRADQPLKDALAEFVASRPAATTLEGYERDVVAYQGRRDGFWGRIVSGLDDYPMRPALQLLA
ncbi:MAG: hypothetical protein JJE46_03445 [Acidimicrobiia bacterium]|nr:hypothetical protein [Acidimicrobiia bacterium]